MRYLWKEWLQWAQTCIFPYREKHQIPWDNWSSLINNNLFKFWLPYLCPKKSPTYPGSSENLSSGLEILRNSNKQNIILNSSVQFISVQSLSHVWLFATPGTAAHQASLSITNSQSLPKLMSIESVMPSNHLILCYPLLLLPSIFPSIRVFSSDQSIGVSASTSVLPVNTQAWSPLGWTGCISLKSKGLSRVFSNTTVQKHQFFGAQLSL